MFSCFTIKKKLEAEGQAEGQEEGQAEAEGQPEGERRARRGNAEAAQKAKQRPRGGHAETTQRPSRGQHRHEKGRSEGGVPPIYIFFYITSIYIQRESRIESNRIE